MNTNSINLDTPAVVEAESQQVDMLPNDKIKALEAKEAGYREKLQNARRAFSHLEVKQGIGLDVKDELEVTGDAIATLTTEIRECEQERTKIKATVLADIRRKTRAETKARVDEIEVDLSFIADPYARASAYAAMAQNGQFQLLWNEDYFTVLAKGMYKRDFGEDAGSTVDDATVPEITKDREEQFERMRANRKDMEALQMIGERGYHQACEELGGDQQPPKLYFRTDQEVRDRKAAKRDQDLRERMATEKEVGDLNAEVYMAGL